MIAMCAGLLAAYLIGCVPFGLILTRLAGLGDIRAIGSGNIGATNVLRTGNKKLAAATLLLDGLKGTAAVLMLPLWLPADPSFDPQSSQAYIYALLPELLGLGVLLGHVFPIWLGFRGGKGVATYLGVMLALDFVMAFSFIFIWLGVFQMKRISSLAALIATLVVMLATLILIICFFMHYDALTSNLQGWQSSISLMHPFLLVGGLLLFYTHRANISRLRAGTEPRFRAKG